MKPYRIVAPFLPLEPEAVHHQRLAAEAFDWPGAIAMLADSVKRTIGCPFHVITDVAADMTAAPTLRYSTRERRLMLWNLEVAACYVESDDFDRDTVMVDSDQLIYGDLGQWFRPRVDLGILIRPKPMRIPILNGVQFLAHRGKERLSAFYRKALEIARGLSDDEIRWGADTHALRMLLEPLTAGIHKRAGLTVSLMDHRPILMPLTETQIAVLQQHGRFNQPAAPVLDFRYTRKRYLKAVYEASFAPVAVPA